ncbi:hypothetical protein [Sulfurimonas sp.]|uniref:hypothetical protein n=2 Tax=Sulfurimonas sp. TaxID=2022749 RepID=UPI003D104247
MSKTISDKIKLSVVARNFEDGYKLNGVITLVDKDKKEYEEKFETEVKNHLAESEAFTTEEKAKSLGADPNEIVEVRGWIDADEDGVADYEEEVVVKIEEAEEKITVIVELPHSASTGLAAKGLAGHTAMAIGEKFFDYGPDYYQYRADEQKYQVDFNKDGDMDDIVNMARKVDESKVNMDLNNDGDMDDIIFNEEINEEFAPGRPWWGEMISKNPKNVTLTQALGFILPDWRTNNVYGTVYKIEFYVKKSQSDKMIEWWEDRYQHLKIYSIKPWIGEQCTTAVKEALAEGGIDDIDWNTLTPDGILEDLKTEIKSTSSQHKDQKAKITLIKKEAIDWKP